MKGFFLYLIVLKIDFFTPKEIIMIKIFSSYDDKVIASKVLVGETTYKFAVEKLYPLINRFEAQRKILDVKFYERLERDILKGCIMPPITIAFVVDLQNGEQENIAEFVNKNIEEGYILDGLQRLNTLKRASDTSELFDNERVLLLNIIISSNEDKLLYRMITLNNGQKAMTPRHQIEILTQELFDFSELNISIQSEKDRGESIIRGSFNLHDISKGYLAFITNSVHIENDKFINEKLDQILIGKILDTDITENKIEFKNVIKLIDKLSENQSIKEWLKVNNNLIGFCVGIKKSYEYFAKQSLNRIENCIQIFEQAFRAINPSKVKLGKYRRELSKMYIESFIIYSDYDEAKLTELFFEETAI